MDRRFLFIAGLALPAVLQAQAADLDGFAQDNWANVAAGGGRLFFALFAGILLAFAIQWILTCLSVATGATAAGKATRRMRRRSYASDDRWREEYRHRDRDRDREFDKAGYREDRDGDGRRDKPDDESWDKPVRKIQTGVGACTGVHAITTEASRLVISILPIREFGRRRGLVTHLVFDHGALRKLLARERLLDRVEQHGA